MTLIKNKLVQQVHENIDSFTKPQAAEAVEAFLRLTKENLIEGSDLLLSGFGKFKVTDKKARKGRNPGTGEDLMLEPRRVVTFRPSRILRDKINNS